MSTIVYGLTIILVVLASFFLIHGDNEFHGDYIVNNEVLQTNFVLPSHFMESKDGKH